MSHGRTKPTSKKTKALLDQLQRKRGLRDLPKRVLIVCEDTESARNYFQAFQQHYKLSATSLEVVGSGHRTQPLQVVQRALERQKEARRRNSGTIPFATAWCVIDGDYGAKVAIARAAINDKTTHLAISTPCFEYWILLHFVENAEYAPACSDVISTLRSGPLPEYEKGGFNYEGVVDHARDAATRAKQLRERRKHIDEFPEHHNPCSEVYKLVLELLPPPKAE